MLDLNDIINNLANKKVTPSWFNTRDWASVAPALRNRSFFSATISSAKVLTKMRNMLLDWQAGAVEDTAGGVAYKETGLAKFRETAAEFMIQEGLATEDDYADQRIQNVVSNARLQLIYNTNLEQAATFAAWQVQMRDPYELNRRPAARFFRRSGAIVKRPRHVAAEGEVRRWDDFAFWMFQNAADIGGFGVPWGPFGFNSYMVQEPVSRAEAERLGLVQKGEVVPVPDLTQFGVSLGSQFNHGVDATLDDVTPEIRAKAQRAIVARLGAGAIGPDGKPTLDALRQARAAIGRPVPPTPVPVSPTIRKGLDVEVEKAKSNHEGILRELGVVNINLPRSKAMRDMTVDAMVAIKKFGFDVPKSITSKKFENSKAIAYGSRNGIAMTTRPVSRELLEKQVEIGYWSQFNPIIHEVGHLEHQKASPNSYDANSTWSFGNKNTEITLKVSRYAQTNPREFVAEVFGGVLSGKTYPPDVMGLYARLGGPPFHKHL